MILTRNNGAAYSWGEITNGIEELRITDTDKVSAVAVYNFEMDENVENLLVIQCQTAFICRDMPLIDLRIRQSYELTKTNTPPDFENLKDAIEDSFKILDDFFKEKNSEYKISHTIKPLTFEEVVANATELSLFLNS